MIIQIWQGITLLSNAEKYQNLLGDKVLPSYQGADGNLGVYLCREVNGQLVNFLLLSLWSSRDALVHFTGPSVETIAHFPEEKKLLLAFETMSRSYEVFQAAELEKRFIKTE